MVVPDVLSSLRIAIEQRIILRCFGKEQPMKHIAVVVICLALAVPGFSKSSQADKSKSDSASAQQQGTTALPQSREKLGGTDPNARIMREALHELLMLPYYSVFDNLEFQVANGNTVILSGQVTRPVLKSDAENAVKKIEGVEKVVNNIEVLPPSPMDDRIRHAEYRAIYGYDGLSRYSWGTVPSIHIIVKNGHVTLVGAVDSEADKNMAGIRANTVPGVFSVTNNLRVIPSGKQEAKKQDDKKK
jgi:hyperosmotically inducible periplasmic protein